MAEMVANGLRFHVQVLKRGNGGTRPRPQVVMVHGLSVDLSCFYVTIAGAVAVESDVHLYDLRGHGRSEIPVGGYRVSDHVADLVALLDGWHLDAPVHVVGNSFGGIIALSLAHHYPERVASLFLIEPHLSDEGWGPRMADSIRDFGGDPERTQRWMGADPARQRWARRNESLLRSTTLLDDLAAEGDLPSEWLERLTCPVFSLYGSESDVIDRAVARDRCIPGCEPVVVAGGTHMVLAEAGVAIRDHAVDWLRQQDGAPVAGHG